MVNLDKNKGLGKLIDISSINPDFPEGIQIEEQDIQDNPILSLFLENYSPLMLTVDVDESWAVYLYSCMWSRLNSTIASLPREYVNSTLNDLWMDEMRVSSHWVEKNERIRVEIALASKYMLKIKNITPGTQTLKTPLGEYELCVVDSDNNEVGANIFQKKYSESIFLRENEVRQYEWMLGPIIWVIKIGEDVDREITEYKRQLWEALENNPELSQIRNPKYMYKDDIDSAALGEMLDIHEINTHFHKWIQIEKKRIDANPALSCFIEEYRPIPLTFVKFNNDTDSGKASGGAFQIPWYSHTYATIWYEDLKKLLESHWLHDLIELLDSDEEINEEGRSKFHSALSNNFFLSLKEVIPGTQTLENPLWQYTLHIIDSDNNEVIIWGTLSCEGFFTENRDEWIDRYFLVNRPVQDLICQRRKVEDTVEHFNNNAARLLTNQYLIWQDMERFFEKRRSDLEILHSL